MSKDCLRTGDKALINFRFIKHPEYMTPGQRMVFREGRTKAVGNVVRIIPQSTPNAVGRVKQNKQQQQRNYNNNNNAFTNQQQQKNAVKSLQEVRC